MIECLIKAEDLYVPNNNLCWTLLRIVICMHKDLLLLQANSAFVYFFSWLNQCSGILKIDRYKKSVINLSILRNQAPSYFIFWSKRVQFQSYCFDHWR